MEAVPDFSYRVKLKAKYFKLQRNYQHSLKVRTDLQLELTEKEGKLAKLQQEVDLLIDQTHDSDYAHLKPQRPTYFDFSSSPPSNNSLPPRHHAPTTTLHLSVNPESSQRPQETTARTHNDSTRVTDTSTTHSRIRKERSPEEEINVKRPRTEQLN